MARRDRIAELISIKERAGKFRHIPSAGDLRSLEVAWDAQLKSISPVDEFVPIRIVTILEVFARYWIETLVDHGAPYVERAARLRIDLKLDYAVASSLQGGAVTLGQLVAHNVSVSRFEALGGIFDTLLDDNFFIALSNARNRFGYENEQDAPLIVEDIAVLKRVLARLFEVRHILVHEFPRKKPHRIEEVKDFFTVALAFMDAAQEELSNRLYGDQPMSQMEMNFVAAERSEAAAKELEFVCAEIERLSGSDTIRSVQRLWQIFAEAEANREVEGFEGGSIRPTIYHGAVESLTRARTVELKDWVERESYVTSDD